MGTVVSAEAATGLLKRPEAGGAVRVGRGRWEVCSGGSEITGIAEAEVLFAGRLEGEVDGGDEGVGILLQGDGGGLVFLVEFEEKVLGEGEGLVDGLLEGRTG